MSESNDWAVQRGEIVSNKQFLLELYTSPREVVDSVLYGASEANIQSLVFVLHAIARRQIPLCSSALKTIKVARLKQVKQLFSSKRLKFPSSAREKALHNLRSSYHALLRPLFEWPLTCKRVRKEPKKKSAKRQRHRK